MNERISNRIARDLGLSDLTEALSDNLSGSDLHSLLLAVLKRRVSSLEPFALTQPSTVTKACDLDGRLLIQLEVEAYEKAPDFEAVELSPLAPLGAVAVLTGLDQANVLSTVRAFESASDPTVGIALECARRRKIPADRKAITRLCTNQRVVRFPLPQNPAYTSHFKLFSLVSAGRDTGSFSFEVAALKEHIECYLSLIGGLATAQSAFEEITVELSDTRVISKLCDAFKINRDEIRSVVRARDPNSSAKILEQYQIPWSRHWNESLEEMARDNLPEHLIRQLGLLQEEIAIKLSGRYPGVSFCFNLHRLTGLGYYLGPCFHIKAKTYSGNEVMLGDGGFVDWTQRLLSDSKERLMTSAIGTELLCRIILQGQKG